MKYDFEKAVDRRSTNALNNDGFSKYLFNESNHSAEACNPDDLIPMWVADMNFKVTPEILNAIKNRLDHGILGYTQIFDDSYFNAFISWASQRYSWHVNIGHIVTSNGIIPALYDLVRLLTKPNEKVLFTTPAYGFFQKAAEHNNRAYITSDLINNDGHYRFDFEDLKRKCALKEVTVCILCNPHNPTGRAWTEAELIKFGNICFENNVLIISDDIHCDLTRRTAEYTPIAKLFPNSENIITCMAPSKTINLAGLMMSNLVIPSEKIRKLWEADHLPFVNPLSACAVEAAYTDGGPWLEQLKDQLDSNFDYLSTFLSEKLPHARFTIPESTYLAWIDLSHYFDSHENLTRFFIDNAGVIIEGGEMFVSENNGFIRINLSHPKETLEMGMGMGKIYKAINNLNQRVSQTGDKL